MKLVVTVIANNYILSETSSLLRRNLIMVKRDLAPKRQIFRKFQEPAPQKQMQLPPEDEITCQESEEGDAEIDGNFVGQVSPF